MEKRLKKQNHRNADNVYIHKRSQDGKNSKHKRNHKKQLFRDSTSTHYVSDDGDGDGDDAGHRRDASDGAWCHTPHPPARTVGHRRDANVGA